MIVRTTLARFFTCSARLNVDASSGGPWLFIGRGAWGLGPGRDHSSLCSRLETPFKDIEDPTVFVCPRIWTDETVVLHRIRRQLPVRLAELDQALCQADDILVVDVRVHHAVEHNERVFQPLGE